MLGNHEFLGQSDHLLILMLINVNVDMEVISVIVSETKEDNPKLVRFVVVVVVN